MAPRLSRASTLAHLRQARLAPAATFRRTLATVQDPPAPPPRKTTFGGLRDQDRIFSNAYMKHDHGIKGAQVRDYARAWPRAARWRIRTTRPGRAAPAARAAVTSSWWTVWEQQLGKLQRRRGSMLRACSGGGAPQLGASGWSTEDRARAAVRQAGTSSQGVLSEALQLEQDAQVYQGSRAQNSGDRTTTPHPLATDR